MEEENRQTTMQGGLKTVEGLRNAEEKTGREIEKNKKMQRKEKGRRQIKGQERATMVNTDEDQSRDGQKRRGEKKEHCTKKGDRKGTLRNSWK